jgi:hypothetical protein
MSIIPKENEKDILGTTAKRFLAVHAKYITCENISQTGPGVTTGPDAEERYGIDISATNKSTFLSDIDNDITLTGDFTQTGDMDITGTFVLSSTATFNGAVTFNQNVKLLSTKYMSDTGAAGRGISFDASGNLEVINKLQAGDNIQLGANFINNDGANNKGLSFTAIGTATFKQDLGSQGDIDASGDITAGGDFYQGVNQGQTVSVDFASYGGILTFRGGILTNKS